MSQLVHFYRDTAEEEPNEYVVIDTEDLDEDALVEEYGQTGFELGTCLIIEGGAGSFPTDRCLYPS